MEIGILLNELHKHEQLDFYEEACQHYHMKPIFLTFKQLAHTRTLPAIIHNRTYAKTKGQRDQLLSLSKQSFVYNGGNRFSKFNIHKMLMQNHYLRPNLPGTHLATADTLTLWMKKYPALILKPDYGSVGHDVMELRNSGKEWLWKEDFVQTAFKSIPPRLLQKIKKHRYIVQQRLPLAERNGSPFDVRVSVQRNEYGVWQITGMVGKQAGPNRFITNIAKGGQAFRMEAVISTAIRHRLEQFSLAIALQLSRFLPNLADIGLDIGMTTDGFPLFIECNFRDLRYSFANVGMHTEWKASYFNPIGYGRFVAQQTYTTFS